MKKSLTSSPFSFFTTCFTERILVASRALYGASAFTSVRSLTTHRLWDILNVKLTTPLTPSNVSSTSFLDSYSICVYTYNVVQLIVYTNRIMIQLTCRYKINHVALDITVHIPSQARGCSQKARVVYEHCIQGNVVYLLYISIVVGQPTVIFDVKTYIQQ